MSPSTPKSQVSNPPVIPKATPPEERLLSAHAVHHNLARLGSYAWNVVLGSPLTYIVVTKLIKQVADVVIDLLAACIESTCCIADPHIRVIHRRVPGEFLWHY